MEAAQLRSTVAAPRWATHQIGERLRVDDVLFEVEGVDEERPDAAAVYRLRPVEASAEPQNLNARPLGAPAPYIDGAMIHTLVHDFYAAIQVHPILGPVFDTRVRNWDAHLPRMVHFWSAILLATPGFQGNPMQRHREIKAAEPGHFDVWLGLFSTTVTGLFAPADHDRIMVRANRIATRLRAAMFPEPS